MHQFLFPIWMNVLLFLAFINVMKLILPVIYLNISKFPQWLHLFCGFFLVFTRYTFSIALSCSDFDFFSSAFKTFLAIFKISSCSCYNNSFIILNPWFLALSKKLKLWLDVSNFFGKVSKAIFCRLLFILLLELAL